MNNTSNSLEQVYSPRHRAKDAAGGGFSSFHTERGELFASWVGRGNKVLDIGCRDGRLARYFLEAGNQVTGLDIDSGALKQCPPEMKTEHHDLNGDWHLQHQNEFDVVVISEVMEHLYYPDQVIQKILSVLKPGGWLIGSVPNAFNLKNRFRLFFGQIQNTPLGEPTHINQFSYQLLHSLLRRHFSDCTIGAIGRPTWRLFSSIFPGLGGFLLTFRAQKKQ